MPSPAPATTAALLLLGACAQLGWEGDARVTNLLDYRASFERALGGFDGALDGPAFAERLRSARVLFLGDHHLDERLHALQRELLQSLLAERRLAFCLEAVGSEDDAVLADYLDGHLDLALLRATAAARWPDSWLDSEAVDSAHYLAVLVQARQSGTPVLGLEPAPRLPLRERDRSIAATVRAAAARFPDRLIVVMVGQTHLLGQGDLIARVRLPHLAIGARPPEELGACRSPEGSVLLRTRSGLLFFRALVPGS